MGGDGVAHGRRGNASSAEHARGPATFPAMRLIPLFLIALAGLATARAAESFTLADGRVLVGTYDEDRQRLKVAGDLTIELTVAPDDIVARAPFVAEEPVEPVAEPDPIDETERDRTRIETTVRMVERRRVEMERYRDWAAKKLATTEAALVETAAAEEAAAARIVACNEAIAAVDAQREGLKDQRALFDARIVAARARLDPDGKVKEVEVAELTQELTRMDERLRELAQRLREHEGTRRTAQAGQARVVAQRRDQERDRDQYLGRGERAERDLATNAASLERLRGRLTGLDAEPAVDPAQAK